MNYFHNWFKQEFNTVYELADGSYTKRRMTLKRYLDEAKQLISHLFMHHDIEESHFFPILARRMPMFNSGTPDARHINSHKVIHKGLENLQDLIVKYTSDSTSYSPDEMRNCLDGFREALFNHLDEEVADLGSANMKRYWTLKEVDELAI